MRDLASKRNMLARALLAATLVWTAAALCGCPGSDGHAAAVGGFAGVVVRGSDDAPITLRLTDTTIPDIGEMRAVGVFTPPDRHGRPITAVLDMNYGYPTGSDTFSGTVSLIGLNPDRGTPTDNVVSIRYVEIDEDRPNGQGLVFPGAISDTQDAYRVTGTATLQVRRDGTTIRVQGVLDAVFTATDGSQRHLAGAFSSNLPVPDFDGAVDLDASAPPPPPSDASPGTDTMPSMDGAPGPDGSGGPLPSCTMSSSPTRTCGLQYEGRVRTCTAGTMVTVGCHAGCMPALGQCAGDAVLQVCAASFTTMPCGSGAIASNDDAPASLGCTSTVASLPSQSNCPAVRFTCPADGHYTVWVGSYSASRPATACVVGASP